MAELEDKIYDRIEILSEEGNEYADNEQYEEAVSKFKQALDLVPSPKTDWEASMWLNASMGDMYFMLSEYGKCSESMFDALNCPDGYSNPFVHLRLGESLFELGEKEKSKEYLLQAYMLEGKEIFETEDSKYFELIKPLI
ncbi:MAG: hypothetical protein LBE91_15325 [Tannerella sp.]|jgi:tetratricopeptide (TPR) repeat protein|nr:hypothetical protein [Tannerella sp.]